MLNSTEQEFFEKLNLITERSEWLESSRDFIDSPHLDETHRLVFHQCWTIFGHRIREQVNDDELLLGLLRCMFPVRSFSQLTLYRGENLDRLNSGRVGFCWTTDISIADMFAKGLNSICSGGATLKHTFPGSAILAGPSPHSTYLGESEYTVNTKGLEVFEVVSYFPQLK